MPGEVAFELLAGIFRFLARIVVEVVFEILIGGTGHFILKTLRPRREPGEISSIVVGLIFWIFLIWAGWAAYRSFQPDSP
jgi:hypothetical protein